MAEHAAIANEFLIRELELTPIECDEFCSFVKKTKES